MIKLFSLKQQKKDGTDTTARTGQKKATAAQLRITKGIVEGADGRTVLRTVICISTQSHIIPSECRPVFLVLPEFISSFSVRLCSGSVFNLLKLDHYEKKERKDWQLLIYFLSV